MATILFYDGSCPLCNRAVRFILSRDQKGHFLFAPLAGQTAEKLLPARLSDMDSLILREEKQGTIRYWTEGKGVFRIFWLLGGRYKLVGWLVFLPSPLFDWFYRQIAKIRYRLFSSPKEGKLDTSSDRFLS